MAGVLYIVGTPIGNLSDLTFRAIETLKNCDLIAAEDTRVTHKLLSYLSIRKPMLSYFEHNKHGRERWLIKQLIDGRKIALVSDAGMPTISDPGSELVQACIKHEIPVTVVPGPSAFTSALAVSGLSTVRFCFEGFLSTQSKKRKEHLSELALEARTIVLYEAPHKLMKTLGDLLSALGDRRISIVREITKKYEETFYGTISASIRHFEMYGVKGEFVLVIEGLPKKKEVLQKNDVFEYAEMLKRQGLSTKDAARKAVDELGGKRTEVYQWLLTENNSHSSDA